MSQVEISYVPSNGKHPKIEVAGFLFQRNKTITLGTSYRCENHKTCPAILHVIENGSYLQVDHNHAPCPEKILARKCIAEGKQMVKENRMITTKQVVDRVEALATAGQLDGGFLGSTLALKRRINDIRLKSHGCRNLGRNLHELEIPDELTKTLRPDKADFLLYDNKAGENRLIIFASRDALSKLEYCTTWLVDGTFKSCPALFAQIYTIHGLYASSVPIPFVFAYLPSKTQEIYTEFFNVIRRSVPGEPRTIISDFEIAAINAMKQIFIATDLRGCLFHLTQSVFRHVQQHAEVFQRYKSNDADGVKVRNAIRSLGGLAFVREPEVVNAFYEIRGQFPQGDSVREIFDYFHRTYVGYNWQDARFPIDFWNVRERFRDNQPRTNNSKEGWHFRFNSMLARVHPSMEASINMVLQEENHWFLEAQRVLKGHIINRRRKSVRIEQRLRNVMDAEEAQSYDNRLAFLSAVQAVLHEFITEA